MLTTKFIIIVINIFALVNGIDQHDELRNELDKPVRSDLVAYLRSLQNIVMFYSREKNIFDANVALGLFFVSENLKKSFQYKKKVFMPSLVENITLLIKNTDVLLEYFNSMVRLDNDPNNQLSESILTLFNNQSQWISEMHKFTSQYATPIPYLYKNLAEKFSSWKSYEDSVHTGNPTPKMSNVCLKELADNPVHTNLEKCEFSDNCTSIITNGTDYGYALTHRILILLSARYGRKCNVLSKEDDKMMLRKFCAMAYSEAVYISMNQYLNIDLMTEQMVLCLMDDHTQFLRRSWFSRILKHETTAGCFEQKGSGGSPPEYEDVQENSITWQFERPGDLYIEGSKCNNHVTAVAAAALSTGVKYILETYY